MNTAIIGYLNNKYHVLATWEIATITTRTNQTKVTKRIKQLSVEYPDIPRFYYIVSSKLLIPGDTFTFEQWDNLVINSRMYYARQQQDWQNINLHDLKIAAIQAKKDLGL